jgi:hypothetical protein
VTAAADEDPMEGGRGGAPSTKLWRYLLKKIEPRLDNILFNNFKPSFIW